MNWFGWMRAFGRANRARRRSHEEATSGGSNLTRSPTNNPPEAPRPSLPRFNSVFANQLRAGVERRLAPVRARLREAFTPSQPVVDQRLFSGRLDVLGALIRAVEDQRRHVVIYGKRGIGKTSTLRMLAQAAQEAQYRVIYISCSAELTLDEFVRAVAAKIPLLYYGAVAPSDPRAERGASLLEVLSPAPVSVRAAGELFGDIASLNVIVMLDEFDRAESRDFRRGVAELMKNLSDISAPVQFVIAGVAQNLTELIEFIPSIQRNLFALHIDRMPPNEVRMLIENGEALSGLKFDDPAVELIVAAADGMPYLASLLCHHAGLCAIEAGRIEVSSGEVSRAIELALSELSSRLSERVQSEITRSLDVTSRQLLGALSRLGQSAAGEFRQVDLEGLLGGRDQSAQCVAILERLSSRGVMLSADGPADDREYKFTEEGIGAYLWLLATKEQIGAKSADGH